MVELATIQGKNSNLSIPLYLAPQNGNGSKGKEGAVGLEQAITEWWESSQTLRASMVDLFAMLENNREEV